MFVELSLQEFTQRLADGKPTPGGGSAAAMAGAMGAGLVSMFCKVTAGKKKYADVKEQMDKESCYAQVWRGRLVELVDKDSAAFGKILAANRMPKETDQEKELRQQAIDAATMEATRVPLETASTCVAVLERIPPLAAKGNPNAISDLKVGMELLWTAFGGGMANVEINLPWLSDKAAAEDIRTEILELAIRAQRALETGREEISKLQ
jgi:glutamate formiminotransferase/formiminotetrahydrofolate cyclodeaminase